MTSVRVRRDRKVRTKDLKGISQAGVVAPAVGTGHTWDTEGHQCPEWG